MEGPKFKRTWITLARGGSAWSGWTNDGSKHQTAWTRHGEFTSRTDVRSLAEMPPTCAVLSVGRSLRQGVTLCHTLVASADSLDSANSSRRDAPSHKTTHIISQATMNEASCKVLSPTTLSAFTSSFRLRNAFRSQTTFQCVSFQHQVYKM